MRGPMNTTNISPTGVRATHSTSESRQTSGAKMSAARKGLRPKGLGTVTMVDRCTNCDDRSFQNSAFLC